MNNKKILIDPPGGSKYGFPKAVPSQDTIHYGGTDYGVSESFDVAKWLIDNGYPQSELDKFGDNIMYKYWTVDVG